MRITKREILFSIIILFVLGTVGFWIHDISYDRLTEENEELYKAVKIHDDPQLFKYVLDTKVGKVLAYGNVSAVEPVGNDELKKDYIYLQRVDERYTMHTRTVTTGSGKHRRTRTEVYWSWDVVNTDEWKTKQIEFLGQKTKFNGKEFNGSFIGSNDLAVENSGGYISDGYRKRHYYTGVSNNMMCSVFTNDELETYKVWQKTTPEQLLKDIEAEQENFHLIFWVIAGLIIAVVIAIFVYQDNDWLE